MKAAVVIALTVIAGSFAMTRVANAQGFAQEERTTCWSWNGGNHSSGSFIECKTLKPLPRPVQVVAAPVPQPMVMSSPVCPPQVILEPEPRKHRLIHRPKPKAVCK